MILGLFVVVAVGKARMYLFTGVSRPIGGWWETWLRGGVPGVKGVFAVGKGGIMPVIHYLVHFGSFCFIITKEINYLPDD